MLCNLYEHRSLNKSGSFRLVAYCITTLFCLMTLMDTKFFSRTFFLQCQPFASKQCQNSIHSRREEGRWFFKSQSWASGGGEASIQRAVFWQMELSSHLIQTKTRKKDQVLMSQHWWAEWGFSASNLCYQTDMKCKHHSWRTKAQARDQKNEVTFEKVYRCCYSMDVSTSQMLHICRPVTHDCVQQVYIRLFGQSS